MAFPEAAPRRKRPWVVGLLALLFIGVLSAANWLRQPAIIQAPLLPMHFGHADHANIDCTSCHHNFIDDTGAGICVDCHKQNPDLAPLIEDQFHDLCRNCHLQEHRDGEDAGPVRSCIACHIEDTKP